MEDDEYSASSTLIPFPTPLPLLRKPIPDPSLGSFLLAFPDTQSLYSSFSCCESQITHQCECGSRVGCSISATKKCKPMWWRKHLIGRVDSTCEEQEMERCVEESRKKCVGFARDKCVSVFREANVVDCRSVTKLLCLATLMGSSHSRGFQFLLALSTYKPTTHLFTHQHTT